MPTVTIDPATVAGPAPVNFSQAPGVSQRADSAPGYMRYAGGAPLSRTTSEIVGLNQEPLTKPPMARRYSSRSH